MGHSQESKQQSHERILRIAARMLREKGLDGVSIANLMQEAGLTHGGFYKHFTSRDDLIAQALRLALADADDPGRLAKYLGSADVPVKKTYELSLQAYLGKIHREDRDSPCGVGTLVSDVARAGNEVKDIYTQRVKKNIAGVTALLAAEGNEPDQDEALLAFCSMVGAFALARAVSDQELSDRMLDVMKRFLWGTAQRPPRGLHRE